MLKEAIDEKFEAFKDSNQHKLCKRILCDKSVILIILSIILCIIFFIVRAQEKVDSDDTSQFQLVNFEYKKYPSFKSNIFKRRFGYIFNVIIKNNQLSWNLIQMGIS
ncbi:hypothetical protein TKK_0000042 [Trichogramma kaykai]|uniref:Transmembrane protein n=1 Tax=Trichogramma kaykai TaxID=54128 RepID=A0ABD2VUL0_9HYME